MHNTITMFTMCYFKETELIQKQALENNTYFLDDHADSSLLHQCIRPVHKDMLRHR